MMNLENLRERPILFNEFSTKANLAGRKSETRRANGFEPTPKHPDRINANPDKWEVLHSSDDYPSECMFSHYRSNGRAKSIETTAVKCPWKRGDLIWGRETMAHVTIYDDRDKPPYKKWIPKIRHDGDEQLFAKNPKYTPSIHLPKSAARQWAIVTKVFPQRLSDITEAQAIAEGVEVAPAMDELPEYAWNNYNKYRVQNHDSRCLSAIDSYRSLLEQMNSPEWVKKNPWLWVVQYDLISTTGRPSDELIIETLQKHHITL